MSTRKRVGVAAAAIVMVLGLAGCAAGIGPSEQYPGAPSGVSQEALTGETQAFYVSDSGAIAVVLWGSSTCPLIGERMVTEQPAADGNAVRVDVRKIAEDQPCTRDLVPHTTVFPTPGDVTTTQPLTIRVADAEVEIVNEVGEDTGVEGEEEAEH